MPISTGASEYIGTRICSSSVREQRVGPHEHRHVRRVDERHRVARQHRAGRADRRGAAVGEGVALLVAVGAGVALVAREALFVEQAAAEVDLLDGHRVVGGNHRQGQRVGELPDVGRALAPRRAAGDGDEREHEVLQTTHAYCVTPKKVCAAAGIVALEGEAELGEQRRTFGVGRRRHAAGHGVAVRIGLRVEVRVGEQRRRGRARPSPSWPGSSTAR